jgi:hypothetical protein
LWNTSFKVKGGKCIVKELKQQLIGQREGMQFALDELEMIKKSIESRIKALDQEIEKIKE